MKKNLSGEISATHQSSYLKKLEALIGLQDDLPGIVVVHKIENMVLEYMSPTGLAALGCTLKEIKDLKSIEYHKKFFNAEDSEDYVPKILSFIEKADDQEIISFFQQVKYSGNNDWIWHYSSVKIFMKDNHNKPTHIITIAHPVDPFHQLVSKINRLLGENNFLRKNHLMFASLTAREKEILKFMALGENSSTIAAKLHISETTVQTHRKNIRNKLNIQSNYDIIKYAQAFDLI